MGDRNKKHRPCGAVHPVEEGVACRLDEGHLGDHAAWPRGVEINDRNMTIPTNYITWPNRGKPT